MNTCVSFEQHFETRSAHGNSIHRHSKPLSTWCCACKMPLTQSCNKAGVTFKGKGWRKFAVGKRKAFPLSYYYIEIVAAFATKIIPYCCRTLFFGVSGFFHLRCTPQISTILYNKFSSLHGRLRHLWKGVSLMKAKDPLPRAVDKRAEASLSAASLPSCCVLGHIALGADYAARAGCPHPRGDVRGIIWNTVFLC